MTVRFIEQPPQEITYHEPGELADKLTPEDVAHVAEIFETPLVGTFNWDYETADERLSRLYSLGKKLNWNAEYDLDWTQTFPKTENPVDPAFNPFVGYGPFEAMSEDEKLEFGWHNQSWTLSQFLHGEQGALLVASQLVSCGPTYDAKLYAASQTFDEARHVEVFNRYLRDKVGYTYPVNPNLKALLDKLLSDPRWDLKFVGMQIIVEGLALAAFNTMKWVTRDALLRELLTNTARDEARHVAFGVIFLEQYVKALSPEEIEERARFAYEACVVMRERLVATEVFAHFGWDVQEARKIMLQSTVMEQFRNLLFTRVIPNLKRIGLLTDSVRPLYEKLGVLEYENLVHDGDIDWAQLDG